VYLLLYWNAHFSRAHLWVWRWGARIKTLAPDYQERKVSIKKMSLSLDYFCLQRATVCYSGLIWSCCGFLEFPPHIPYSGSFNLFLWWCKEYVKQSCKNMLIVLVSWHYFLVGANFWGRYAKNCAIMSIFFWAIFGLFCILNFGAIVVSKLWLHWVSLF